VTACYVFLAGFLLGLLFDPEDGGDIFLRNVGWLSMDKHGVMSHKWKLFMISTVRTSDPDWIISVGCSVDMQEYEQRLLCLELHTTEAPLKWWIRLSCTYIRARLKLTCEKEENRRVGGSHLGSLWSPVLFFLHEFIMILLKTKTPWSESASELYRLSDRRLSAKWLPTFADRGYHVVSVTDLNGRILGFLDRSRYFSIK
jgi:hypothetical protein